MLLPLLYNNEVPTSQLSNLKVFSKAFSNENIDRLNNMIYSNPDTFPFSKGMTGSQRAGNLDFYESNNRDIAYISPSSYTRWLYDLLFPLVLEANNDLYHFDIDIVTDPIHYVIYPENGGHLEWHLDIGNYEVNHRKLALTIELSDSDSYEGGEFEIFTGGKNPVTIPKEKGDILIFPTFLLHRVKPITRGVRKCLVFWVGGKPFR